MAQRAQVVEQTPQSVRERYDREGPIFLDEDLYVLLALDDPNTKWELHDGVLWEKPGMSYAHVNSVARLVRRLIQQLDEDRYVVLSNDGRVRRSARNYLIPDVSVVPTSVLNRHLHEDSLQLGVFNEPLPFVAEAWSPSTGTYDVNTKIPEYKRRGDLEIWRLHPYERTLTVWRRISDGVYDETIYHGGIVQISSLPGVTINLDELFV